MTNIIYNVTEFSKATEFILSKSKERLYCFRGDLGAGKTTLIKALIHSLGASDAGSSPTFSLVNEYYDPQGKLLAYHLDCYRLEDEEEALDLGIEQYLEADCWVFVEWADRIHGLLPENRTEISLHVTGANERKLELQNLPCK